MTRRSPAIRWCRRSSRPRCSPSPPTRSSRTPWPGGVRRPIYSRGDNPTVAAFEAKLAALEGAEAARGFASGMAAISAAVLSNLSRRRAHGLRAPLLPGRLPAVRHRCCRASTSGSSSSTAAMPARSSRRCRAPRCSTWKARPAWCSRPRISPASRPRRKRAGRRHDRRQLLGQPDLPAADRARRRPRGAFRLEISRRPQRRGRGRGLRPARPDRADRRRRLPAARRQAVAVRRLAAGARPAHPALAHAPPPRERARDRAPARRAIRRCAGSTIPLLGEPGPGAATLSGASGLFSLRARSRPGRHRPLLRRARACSSSASAGAATRAWCSRRRPGSCRRAPPTRCAFFGVSPATIRLHIGLEDPEDLWSDLRQALDA